MRVTVTHFFSLMPRQKPKLCIGDPHPHVGVEEVSPRMEREFLCFLSSDPMPILSKAL